MTRTRKVRRRFVAEKYAPVIDAFYAGGERGRAGDRDHLRGRPPGHHPVARAHRGRGAGRPPMSDDFGFFLLLMSNGVLIGLMYSLIALGFVLVYKATDAVNFAQGEFVMIAGFVVGRGPRRLRRAAVAGRRARARRHDRLRLRPRARRCCASSSAGRSIAVVMATIGLAVDPARDRAARSSAPGPSRCRCPSATSRSCSGPLFIPPIQLLGAGGEPALPGRLRLVLPEVAARASPCARSPTTSRWPWPWASTSSATSALAWAMTGIVSALGGIIWGNLLGVDVNLALVGLQGVPGGDPGRPRLDPRRHRRRAHRRHRREHGRRLRRSLRGRRHQGLRALRADDRRADDPALRHLRQDTIIEQESESEASGSDPSRVRACLKTTLRGGHGAVPAAHRALDGGGDRGAVLPGRSR